MKRYINVKENFVMFAIPNWFAVDCSSLLNKGIVFVGEDVNGFWYETEPFNGRHTITNTTEIEALFEEAKTKFIEYRKSIKPTEVEIKLFNLKQKLTETDYKDLPSYDKRGTEEWTQLMAQRQAWREEIRSLGG